MGRATKRRFFVANSLKPNKSIVDNSKIISNFNYYYAIYAQKVINKRLVNKVKKTRVCKSYQQNAENATFLAVFRALKYDKCQYKQKSYQQFKNN